ncbi:transcriptional regulator, partial [Sporosarcina sp. FSL K6-6792]
MKDAEMFWSASQDELKQGYIEVENQYVCLLCGNAVEKGIVYPKDGVLYEAKRYMRIHIEHAHSSVFEYL